MSLPKIEKFEDHRNGVQHEYRIKPSLRKHADQYESVALRPTLAALFDSTPGWLEVRGVQDLGQRDENHPQDAGSTKQASGST